MFFINLAILGIKNLLQFFKEKDISENQPLFHDISEVNSTSFTFYMA